MGGHAVDDIEWVTCPGCEDAEIDADGDDVYCPRCIAHRAEWEAYARHLLDTARHGTAHDWTT